MMYHTGWYAPFGEDRYLITRFPEDFKGFAAEVGAWDGHQGSTTLSLERAGWTVLCVEANPECEAGLKLWRKQSIIAAASDFEGEAEFHVCGSGANMPGYSALKPIKDHPYWKPNPNAPWWSLTVPVRTLDSMLEQANFPRLDALSIDVEGGELDVLKGLNLDRWKPKALVIEQWDEDNPVRPYLAERGYRFDERLYVNDCFIRI